MANIKELLAGFFRSEHKSIKDYEQFLTESKVQEDWDSAVALYREGIKKMQNNNLEGLDCIRKASVCLKSVVKSCKEPKVVEEKIEKLNESVSSVDVANLMDEAELLEYQFHSLVDSLKEEELDFISEEDLDVTDPAVEDPTTVEPEVASTPTTEVAPGVIEPEVVEPSEPSAPVEPTPTATGPVDSGAELANFVKEDEEPVIDDTPIEAVPSELSSVPTGTSAYNEGFEAGRKSWKAGSKPKEVMRKIVEDSMGEKAYSYVERWQEGFNAGYAHEEQVKTDLGEVERPE